MVSNFDKDPAILIDRRHGSPESPYVDMNETLTINTEGKAILSEIPLKYDRVRCYNIKSPEISEEWYEIEDGIPSTVQYKVDYVNKIVTFHISHVGKQINAVYTGTGNHYYSISSIYTEQNNGKVTETLEDLTIGATDVIKSEQERKASELSRVEEEGIREQNEQARKLSETERVSSEATRVSKESVREESEALRKSSETQRVLDEDSRKLAETSRASEEDTRALAEGQRSSSETVRKQNEDARISSETVRESSEANRIAKESERIEAESNRKLSEDSRVSAESTRELSETERLNSEIARTSSESERELSEASRKSSESSRVIEEGVRKTAEGLRNSSESTRKENEDARKLSEASRVEAESSRSTSESKRVFDENARTLKETERQSNEDERKLSETARANEENKRDVSESSRISAEVGRVNEESKRVTSEQGRDSAELIRASDEQARDLAEGARVIAENKRAEDSSQAISRIETATSNVNAIVDNTGYLEEYNGDTQYYKNNVISFQGNSYMARKEVLGIPPVDGESSLEWGLLARRGLDGEGSVASVNNVPPDISGNVILKPSDIGASATDHIHTVSQVTGLQTALDEKVDKVTGKQLSTEDYTTAEKTKLGGIQAGAEKNIPVPIASKVQAEAGTDNTNFMTPLRTKEAIMKLSPPTDISGKVDKVAGKQLSTEDYTTAEKTKLSGVASGANNYVHPTTHPATMITEDSTHRFGTDAKFAEWDDKETSQGAQAKVDALAGSGNTKTVKQLDDALATHSADKTSHVQPGERENWNAKATPEDVRIGIEQSTYSITKSAPDAAGTFTTIEYKRKPDGTLAAKSVLSGGTAPKYTTRTITYYGTDGLPTGKVDVFALTYNSDGVLIGEV